MLERFLNFILRIPNNVDEYRNLGVDLSDTTQEGLVDFNEVVARASFPALIEKDPSKWRTFLAQYQSSSSSCVAFTLAKLAQIFFYLRSNRKIKFSPGWIYRQRTPKGEGMNIGNATKLASQGMIPEELYPSENLTDEQIDALKDEPFAPEVAKEFSIPQNWVELHIDFDTIASTIQKTGKGIMLWFRFGKDEWFRKQIPEILTASVPYVHSVTAVDAFLYRGVPYILVEDSADLTFNQRKLISGTFLERRCLLARYPLRFKFDPETSVKPSYDGSVGSLQDCLTYEGLFPSNVTARGYYGTITRNAVTEFQKKYDIDPIGTVGPKTTTKLKELYP